METVGVYSMLAKLLASVVVLILLVSLVPIPMEKVLDPQSIAIDMDDSRENSLLLLGDSIALQYSKYLSDELGDCAVVYVLLKPRTQTLWQFMTSPAMKFLNVKDSSHFRSNVRSWVNERDFDAIAVNVGVHDIKRGDGTFALDIDETRYRTNLVDILTHLTKQSSRTFYVATTPVIDGTLGHRLAISIDRLNAVAHEVSESLEVDVIPVPDIVKEGAQSYLQPDGIHLTEEGAQYFAEAISRPLKQKICGTEIDITQ